MVRIPVLVYSLGLLFSSKILSAFYRFPRLRPLFDLIPLDTDHSARVTIPLRGSFVESCFTLVDS